MHPAGVFSREGLRPRVLFVRPSGVLGVDPCLLRGRRINCSQKCGKTARWHQKLRTFGALALEGGAWGGQFLLLFVVLPLTLLVWDGMVDNSWSAVFVAICGTPAHFAGLGRHD